jgi:radical SAM-linked protein
MRIRVTFSKYGPMQYIGHLDLHRSWERTFRRAGLLLGYSQGYHPQPHLNLACALPLGFTSDCEILDAWLENDPPLYDVSKKISQSLPPGLRLGSMMQVAEHLPALQTQVLSAVYVIVFLDDIPDLNDRIEQVLSAEHLPRVRRGKPYDLRPLIERATLTPASVGEKTKFTVQMSARQAATGRPEELLSELGVNFQDTQVHRQKIILSSD